MAVKKSFFISFISLITFVFCLFPSAFAVKADGLGEMEYSRVLDVGYARVNEFISQEGDSGIFTEENVGEMLSCTSSAVIAAENLKYVVTSLEYSKKYQNKHTDVLRVCKNSYIWLMENGYDLNVQPIVDFSVYAPTSGGIVLVRNKLKEFKDKIELAETMVEIDVAFVSWELFINSGEPALKVDSISSDKGIGVKLEADELIFAEDDVVEVAKFLNSVIIKNTQSALVGNENLLSEDSGIAYFFSLRWKSDGVIVEGNKVPETPIKVSVKLKDLGLENATDVQLVRYKGSGEVEFVDGVEVKDGYLTFTLKTFGNDIESDYALDFAVVAKGYKQEAKPIYLYVLIGAVALLFVLIISQMIRGVKKRRRKKDYKKFLKRRKQERKNKFEEETIEEL